MLLLQIKKANQFTPIRFDNFDMSKDSGGRDIVKFAGDHPYNPESGSVELVVNVLSGGFDGITDLIFITPDATKGKLKGWKKNFLGNTSVEVDINTIFLNGLEYSAKDFIISGGGIIGLSGLEMGSLDKFQTQQDLLETLTGLLMPDRKREILELARPGLICLPNQANLEDKSHFLGKAKNQLSSITSEGQGKPLFPIASIKLSEYNSIVEHYGVDKNLSFYLKVDDSVNGWPEKEHEFKVATYSEDESISVNELHHHEGPINFDTQFILDLPDEYHSVVELLDLNDDELEQFEALRETFMGLIHRNRIFSGLNKLLGYPESIQSCVSYEAERIHNNRDYGDDILKEAGNWHLLLQISPYCKAFDFFKEFGDATIYFMIHDNDLKNGNFNNCQVVCQST